MLHYGSKVVSRNLKHTVSPMSFGTVRSRNS